MNTRKVTTDQILSAISDLKSSTEATRNEFGTSLESTENQIMSFLQEHMVTKEEAEKFATKEEMKEMKSEIMTNIDGFLALHTNLDHEVVALRSAYGRHEDRLNVIERKFGGTAGQV
jgi:uncharacterized protein YukE